MSIKWEKKTGEVFANVSAKGGRVTLLFADGTWIQLPRITALNFAWIIAKYVIVAAFQKEEPTP